jgi:hypothetical protein
MGILIQNGLIKAKQLDQRTLIPVSKFLASRGFSVTTEGSTQSTLLPREQNFWDAEEANIIFSVFDDPLSREELKSLVEGTLTCQLSETVAQLTNLPGFHKNQKAFSTTFEWYVGELMIRQFGAFSASFAVEVKNILRNSNDRQAGDYDVLAVLRDLQLLYIECKSGKFDSQHILKAVERGLALHCVRSVILTGSEINEHDLHRCLQKIKHPTLTTFEFESIAIKGIPNSLVYRWLDCYFVPADENSGSLEAKLQTVLRVIAADCAEPQRMSRSCSQGYGALGYIHKEISLKE